MVMPKPLSKGSQENFPKNLEAVFASSSKRFGLINSRQFLCIVTPLMRTPTGQM
jgi:hypothetical protein